MAVMLSKIWKSNANVVGFGLNSYGVRRILKFVPQRVQSSIVPFVNCKGIGNFVCYVPKHCFSTSSILKTDKSFMNIRAQLKKLGLTQRKSFLIGIGFGGAIGASYAFLTLKSRKTAIANEPGKNDYILQDVPPSHPVSRSVKGLSDNSGLKITIYQFQTCPFCCKVRAYLDYYGFSYDIVEVNSISRKQTKWSNYRKVPFLIIEQDNSKTTFQLKDSSMIISALHSLLVNKESNLESIVKAYPILQSHDESGKVKSEICNKYAILHGKPPSTKENVMNERKWRQWTDDVYVHMLSPNIYRTMNESFQAFSWFSKVGQWEELFSKWERFLLNNIGAVAMYFIGKMLKKRYHLEDDVRFSLYEESEKFLKLTKGQKFIGGTEPNLSDLSIFGVLSAIEGCDAFQDLLQNVKLESWFYSVKERVNNHEGNSYLVERFVDI